MPRYDATRPNLGPAAPRPFPGDHLKRTGKGRRPAETPPQSPVPAADDAPAPEGGREPAETPGQEPDQPPAG